MVKSHYLIFLREVISETTTLKIGATKYKDTGGGFLLEEPDNSEISVSSYVKI